MAKLGEGLKIKYEPIWPQAPIDTKFHYYEEQEDGTRVLKIHEEFSELITDINRLEEFVDISKDKLMSFDTETTGLTYIEDKIVGFSFSFDRWKGYYVPIRHKIRQEVVKEEAQYNEDGTQIFLKSGKPKVKKVTSYIIKECEDNLNDKKALDLMYKMLTNAKRVIMHNSEFDLNMIKFEGYDVGKIRSFDTLILPYIFDPEATKLAGLKALEKRVLGRTVPEFKEVLGKKNENFSLVNPRDGYQYCCYDASGVFGIYEEMYPKVRELLDKYQNKLVFDGKPYNVMAKDNQMVKMFVDYYGHVNILVDKDKAIQYKKQLEEERDKVVSEIYEYFDRGTFNLSTSSKEFKEVMGSKNVYTRVKTGKGGHSWSKKAAIEMKKNIAKLRDSMNNWSNYSFSQSKLSKSKNGYTLANILYLYGTEYFKMDNKVNDLVVKNTKGDSIDYIEFWLTVKKICEKEEEKIHILALIQKNNSLNKALNSYVDKLTQVNMCHMRYRLKGTKSGRLSSGNGSKSDKKRNHYYIDLNAQNLTKPASGYYVAEKCDISDEEGILGWKFCPVKKDYALENLEKLYIVEGQDSGITIRGCLKAPKGRYVVSLDYDAQEYRLMAILSRDTQMLYNFHNGIDPHTASAYAIWGEANYDKAKRKKAKIFNFLNNYGGGAFTLAQQLDISEQEAQGMIDKYNQTFHEMVEWKQSKVEEMYQNEAIVFTAFGRPRQFKGWMNTLSKNRENYSDLDEKEKIEKAVWRVQSAIERRVSSHLIQGTAGDILRLVLFKLYIKYFMHRNPHIDFLSTVHDEINYTIDKDVTTDYVRELEQIMTFDTLDKSLPIATSTDIGYTYGNMFPFVWSDDSKTVLIPKRVHHA